MTYQHARHGSASLPLTARSTASPRLALFHLPQPSDAFRCRTSSPGSAAIFHENVSSSASPVPGAQKSHTLLHCSHCRSSWTPAAHLRAERVHLRHCLAQYARARTAGHADGSSPPPWRHVLPVPPRQVLNVSPRLPVPTSVTGHGAGSQSNASAPSADSSHCATLIPSPVQAKSSASALSTLVVAGIGVPVARKLPGPKIARVRRMPVRLPHFYAVRAVEQAAKRAGMASGRISSPTTGLAHVSLQFARRWTRWIELCTPAQPQTPATSAPACSDAETAAPPPLGRTEHASIAAPVCLKEVQYIREQKLPSMATLDRTGCCGTPPGQDT